MPFRELGFSGVPFKSAVFVMPSVSCLVELIEMPFLVVALEDIELVNLERVGFNLKNFDMAIVFKVRMAAGVGGRGVQCNSLQSPRIYWHVYNRDDLPLKPLGMAFVIRLLVGFRLARSFPAFGAYFHRTPNQQGQIRIVGCRT